MTNRQEGDGMKEDVTKRLEALGYAVSAADDWTIDFVINKTENYYKNSCNTSEVPEGLYFYAVDRAAGEFLAQKKTQGQLDDIFNIETPVSSVKLGDTDVKFADSVSVSPSARLDALIKQLINGGESEIPCYRKIRW